MSDASSSDDFVPPSSIVDKMPTPPGALPVRCPHCLCQTPISKDQSLSDARCVSCGSELGLLHSAALEGRLLQGSGAARGERISHFELLERLGAGGFGEVWKARDVQLDRIVAVKLPHRGRLGPAEREKFLREARAAAQLRHANIVSVHEAGIEGEYLYIASDFIEGVPLEKWASDRRPSFRDSAILCRKIADALDHAHEEGVIHRDLKPSNIMIDCAGQPHIMDFGLAKRLVGEVTMTVDGQILGTPAYMSPEQAKGSAHAADRRTDIYSLGVILFELLTGERPFRGNTPMLLKQVIEDDPPGPRKLDGRIPRDLETACLKCLEKEPSRRYGTAREVSEELTRFLSGMPIHARPVGAVERLVRWCRRNPLVATAATVAVACLLVALAATSLGYLRAARALEETRQAVDDLFTRVSEETLLNEPGMQPLRRDLLRRARDYYERFLVQSGGSLALRDELALAHFRVGLITDAIESPAKAMNSYDCARQIQEELVRRDPHNARRLEALGDTLNAIGISFEKQQRLDRALEAYAAAIDIRQRLVSLVPESRDFRRTLANSWMNTGLAEMERDTARARKCLEKAQVIRQELLSAEDDPKVRRDLAMGYHNLGTLALKINDMELTETSLEKARQLFQELHESSPSDINLLYQAATSSRRCGDLKCRKNQPAEATALYAEARAALELLAARNPAVAEYQVALAEVHIALADAEFDRGNRDAVLACFERSEAILTPLVAEHSGTGRYYYDFVTTLLGLARLHPDAARRQKALGTLQAFRQDLQETASGLPDAGGLRQQLDSIDQAIARLRSAEAEKSSAPPSDSAPPKKQ